MFKNTKGRTLRLVAVGWSSGEHQEAEGVVDQACGIGLKQRINAETEGAFSQCKDLRLRGKYIL